MKTQKDIDDAWRMADAHVKKLQEREIELDELIKEYRNKALSLRAVVGSLPASKDVGVNLEFIGETYEIMEGVMFEKGTKSWLPTDEWEKIKDEMTYWKVI